MLSLRPRSRCLSLVCALFALSACSEDETTPADTLPEGCDVYLTADAGEDAIQTALIEVQPDQTVCFAEGRFAFTGEVSLSVDGVTMKGAGMDATVFDFTAQEFGANGVAITGDGCTVEELQVLDAKGDGIRGQSVDGITFRRLKVWWTADASAESGAYGVYPVESTNVRVEDCVVKGASDAGVYVGQSRTILVKGNEVFGNVAGIEIENSVDAEVVDNHVHDNVGGILVFALPELPMKDAERSRVHDNLIENNNLPNFAKSGSIVSLVPGGTGAFIMASNHNEFTNNTFRGNLSAGMMIVDYIPALFGTFEDDAFTTAPLGNHLHGNTYEDNGGGPMGILADLGLEAPAYDVLMTGCPTMAMPTDADRTCVREDAGIRFVNLNLGLCGGSDMADTDPAPYDCSHDPLPTQDP